MRGQWQDNCLHEVVFDLFEQAALAGLVFSRQGFPELLEQLSLVAGELCGTLTSTCTNRSPRPRPFTSGTPWCFSRNLAPLCVPSGIFSGWTPSSVGTSISAPRAACAMFIGMVQCRSLSCALEKRVLLHRDEHVKVAREARRSAPAWPCPESRRRVPSSTPAGMFTLSLSSVTTYPSPRHCGQALRMIWPAPPHCEHVRRTERKPCW